MELQVIKNKIFEIRGMRVMLDYDLAELYQVETKNLKRSVRRNIERFPSDFMFELTKDEYDFLRCNFGTLENSGRGQYAKYLPFAFTEQGVAQLSSVLNSTLAIQVNISIIRAFVTLRQFVLTTPILKVDKLQNEVRELKEYIEEVFADYNDINDDTRMQLELINETLAELQIKNKTLNIHRRPVGYVKPVED